MQGAGLVSRTSHVVRQKGRGYGQIHRVFGRRPIFHLRKISERDQWDRLIHCPAASHAGMFPAEPPSFRAVRRTIMGPHLNI